MKFLLTEDHAWWKFQNATPPTVFIQSGPNFMINKAVIRQYNVMDTLLICQKLTKKNNSGTVKF